MTGAPCTEQEISDLVHAFYARVREDEALGPIFNARIDDWDRHLARLVDFWSSVLRRTGRFTGTPMPKHAALPGLNAALFERWLGLFHEVSAAQPNRRMGEQAYAAAQRIAQSLWMGYQMSRQPGVISSGLSHG
jgi:hemoglobin